MQTGICPSSKMIRLTVCRSLFKSSEVELIKIWYFLGIKAPGLRKFPLSIPESGEKGQRRILIVLPCLSPPVHLLKALPYCAIIMDMTTGEKYAYWLQLAQYDLDSADTMYRGGRWFYVAFMCQQALEKLCKGLYNFYINDNVPKVHNIRFILSQIETKISTPVTDEIYNLVDTLSAYYLNSRYPDFAGQSGLQINNDTAAYLLQKTREAFTWLLTLKQSGE
jgi:HEPN domain-containing protein